MLKNLKVVVVILLMLACIYGCKKTEVNNFVKDNNINTTKKEKTLDDYINEIVNGDRKPIEVYFDVKKVEFPEAFFQKLYDKNIWVSMTYDGIEKEEIEELENDNCYIQYQIQSVFVSKALDEYIKEFKKSSYQKTLSSQIEALENIEKIFYDTHISEYDDDWDCQHGVKANLTIVSGDIIKVEICCKNGDCYRYRVIGDGTVGRKLSKTELVKKYNDVRLIEWKSFNSYNSNTKQYDYFKMLINCQNAFEHKNILNYKIETLKSEVNK